MSSSWRQVRPRKHALVVTAAGKPELRAVAARWLAAAPLADSTWEYHSARIADATVFDNELGFGDLRLSMSGLRFAFTVDDDRGQIDVACHHPDFARLPEGARAQVHVPEPRLAPRRGPGRDVDRPGRMGRVGPRDFATSGRAARSGAPAGSAERQLDPDGRSRPGRPAPPRHREPSAALGSLAPLRPALGGRPAVSHGQRGQAAGGDSLDALRAFEDGLVASVGADGTLAAHETGDLLRTLHVYVDSQSQARQRAEAALPGWTEGRAKITAKHDPALADVGHLG